MNTAFALLSRFESPTVKLEDISEEYFGMKKGKAYERAALNQLPVPTFRASESQKAPRLVHVDDLARWLDEQRARARAQWERSQV
jgi:Pyocin activator protein PrtN